ncbi:uncharacterized protein LOC113520921 isoform X2 [Galleria mellonella]|uniref:Uncharacterized protein LOC113520921 isoform X2 n=1 Tax=Galleria mellonella TaxID=7137 RepID=A0A6J3C535_GALME|nr:uncharacterized protein LOC113520921 isoform X2 [Galleria mellonella]
MDNKTDNTTTSTYKCAICNIVVPKMYWKLHNNSFKHRTCLEIADLALLRVKESLSLDLSTCRDEPSTYFCEPCCLSVATDQKFHHITSKTHADSMKHDELLCNLLKIYKDKNNVNEIDIKYNITIGSSESVRKNTTGQTAKKLIRLTETDVEVIDGNTNEDDNTDIELSILNKHIHEINDKYKSQGYIYILKNKYVHVAIDKELFHVNVRNLNGIKKFQEYNNWKCLLCNEWLKTKNDIVTHCQNEKHVRNISVPNYHCLRAFESLKDTQVHCIICNKQMPKDVMENHILSEEHKVAIDRSLIYKIDHLTSDIIVCQICNTAMFVGNFSSHEKGQRHLNNLNENEKLLGGKHDANLTANVSTGNQNPILATLPHYQMNLTSSPKVVECKVCHVNVPNNKTHITDHVNGRNHSANYDKMLSNNNMRFVDNGFYCSNCDVNISAKNELFHINGRNHQSNINNRRSNE